MFRHLLLFLTFSLLFEISIYSQNVQIQYLGHSAFVIQFDNDSVADYFKNNYPEKEINKIEFYNFIGKVK